MLTKKPEVSFRPTPKPPKKKSICEDEVTVKYIVQCLNASYTPTKNAIDAHSNTMRVRKTYVRPGMAWSTFEKELKKECNCATIKKIKYVDEDGDKIYIVDSQELEAAIFKEGVMKFDILYFKHEIVYTANFINDKNPDEPNGTIGTRKAYPVPPNSIQPGSSGSVPHGAWDIFMSTVHQTSKNAQIKKIRYTDENKNEIYIVNREELDKAIFTEGRCRFHVLFELEIIYTANRIDEKRADKPNKDIGYRKAYPLPSIPGLKSNKSDISPDKSAWNIFSSTINQIYESSEIKKVRYVDKNGKEIFIVNGEELDKAIFSEGVSSFHILYKH